jgi:hypothetical protein
MVTAKADERPAENAITTTASRAWCRTLRSAGDASLCVLLIGFDPCSDADAAGWGSAEPGPCPLPPMGTCCVGRADRLVPGKLPQKVGGALRERVRDLVLRILC